MAVRLLLALLASTGVTAAVAGPMAYQSHMAQLRNAHQHLEQKTTTTEAPPTPQVLGETTVPLPDENTATTVPAKPPTPAPPTSKTPSVAGPSTSGRGTSVPTTRPPVVASEAPATTAEEPSPLQPVPKMTPPTTGD